MSVDNLAYTIRNYHPRQLSRGFSPSSGFLSSKAQLPFPRSRLQCGNWRIFKRPYVTGECIIYDLFESKNRDCARNWNWKKEKKGKKKPILPSISKFAPRPRISGRVFEIRDRTNQWFFFLVGFLKSNDSRFLIFRTWVVLVEKKMLEEN